MSDELRHSLSLHLEPFARYYDFLCEVCFDCGMWLSNEDGRSVLLMTHHSLLIT